MNRYAQYARWNAVRKATGYRSGFEAEVGAALDPHGALFQSLTARTSPKIGQTYAQWAAAHGFPCCKGPAVPEDWLKHKPSARSRKAFEAIHAPR